MRARNRRYGPPCFLPPNASRISVFHRRRRSRVPRFEPRGAAPSTSRRKARGARAIKGVRVWCAAKSYRSDCITEKDFSAIMLMNEWWRIRLVSSAPWGQIGSYKRFHGFRCAPPVATARGSSGAESDDAPGPGKVIYQGRVKLRTGAESNDVLEPGQVTRCVSSGWMSGWAYSHWSTTVQ